MGRPSLAAERREQILAAVERCIVRHGLGGTTIARIAAEAGVQPSLVSHYFGGKDAVLDAAVERTLENFRRGFRETVAGVPAGRRLERLLDVLFSDRLASPEFGLMVDVLVAASYWSEPTRRAVRLLYEDFERMVREVVDAARPDAPARERAALAYGLLCLADANNTLRCIGFGPARHARAKGIARRLVDSIRPRSE